MVQYGAKIYMLMALGAYAMLLFVLHLAATQSGNAEPFSIEAFYKPFGSIISIVLAAVAVFEVLLFHVWMMPHVFMADPRNAHAASLAIIMPEVIAVLGFVIGFISMNFWVALPFFAVAAAHSLYAFSRMREEAAG